MKKTKLHALTKFLLLMATCFFWQVLSAQDQPNITVTGTIIDSLTNEPVIGAVVAVQGTTKATTTDIDGKYSIEAPANATLVVSYAGFAERLIPVNNASSINVSLKEDTETLREIVAVGYGTQEKEDVTGAISSVRARELTQVVVTDATQAVQGRVTGVTVTQNTGAPGSPVTIQVRGVGTIGNSNPLYVVNGVPMGDISYLNSNDIEGIDILKDASSAAVYGSRAANGVVLITTKKGSTKSPNVEFRYLTGISEAWRLRSMTNAQQWGTLVNEAALRETGKPRYNVDTLGQGTDWQNEIFRKARMNSYYLSTSGGSEKYNYYASGSYLQQQGIIKNSDYSRFNFNVNGDYKISNKIKAGAFLNSALSSQNLIYDIDPYSSVIPSALRIDPVTQVYTGKGGDTTYASGQPTFPAGITPRTDAPNPVAILNNRGLDNNKLVHLVGSVFAEYEILKGLKLKTQAGGFYSNLIFNGFNARYYVDNTNQLSESNITRRVDNSWQIVWENSLAYDRTFAEKHKVGLLLLTGVQNNRFEQFEARKSGTATNDPGLRYFDAATDVASATAQGYATENALVSYLGRVNYEFNNKYLITANVRRDGSSRFPSNNRWGNFPSFAAGWKVSNEEFFSGLKGVVSFFKIRGSYGKLGNQNISGGDYPYTTNIASGGNDRFSQNYVIGGTVVNGSSPRGLGNRSIKWETVTTSNIGVDLGFLNDKILLTADYFTKRTTDMLIRRNVPAVAGVIDAPYVNYGEMLNKGVELSLEYRNYDKAFKYRFAGNITSINNKITKLGDPIIDGPFLSIFANQTAEGRSVAEFYGYKVEGIVQTAEEAAALQKVQAKVEPGDFKFANTNGDSIINDNDRQYLGSPLPKFTYGFNANFEFKGFDLVVFFQGVQGNKIFNAAKYNIESGTINSNFTQAMLDRWTGPGTSNTIPRITISDPNYNRRPSSYYVEDGSYLRLKNVQFGYTIPEALGKKLYFQKVRVFVAAQNLLTFTKYTGLDPEIGRFNYAPNGQRNPSPLDIGIDRGGTYPQARTFQIGVNATF